MDELRADWLADLVGRTLDEDLGVQPAATGSTADVPPAGRDVTTQAIFDVTDQSRAVLAARQAGVVAGLAAVQLVLTDVAARFGLAPARVELLVADGTRVAPGDRLAIITGPTQVLLMAERTALNIVSRASGVATATRQWADKLADSPAQVLDTRKTTPGLRELEKYAVRQGGGTNKRLGLYDAAMIKDNHIAAAGSIGEAMSRVREAFPGVTIQVEADRKEQALEAITAGARFLLLDNMTAEELRETVTAIRNGEARTGKVELEATGNLTLDKAAAVAATGVDYMSVGALTHSSAILDIGLDMEDC